MKTLELESLGLTELTNSESVESNGGWWQVALAIAGAVIYVVNNADDFIAGVKEGYTTQQAN